MPNIVITSYCNLHCPYCFAQQMMNEQEIKNITEEQLDKILNWLDPVAREKHLRIGLIGGEPTLHPDFVNIINKIGHFCYLKQIDSFLFTNGIKLTKELLQEIPDNMDILLNYNHPNLMSEQDFQQLNKNINLIYNLNWLDDKVTLGLNLYKELNNYQYFKDIILKYHIKKFRLTLASIQTNNLDEYYQQMKPYFMDIINFAINNGVEEIFMDCRLPTKYFTEEEKKQVFKMRKEDKYIKICEPAFDITPDFKASFCFANYNLKDCENKTYEEIYNQFKEKVICEWK